MTLCAETCEAKPLLFEPMPQHVKGVKPWQEYGGEVLMSSMPSIQRLRLREEAMLEQSTAPSYGSFPTATRVEEEEISIEIPPLEGFDIHSPVLTSNICNLLRNFWAIVISKALQTSFPVWKTTIAVFTDPAEDRQQAVLRVFTEASASQSIAFWEGLENNIQDWVTRLNEQNRSIFLRDISLRIHWQ